MTAEPRDVEEIRADIAWSRQTRALATTSPGVRIAIEARLIADVEPLLARLAAADRENADLRASNHAAIRLIREHGDVTAERDDLRAQLAAAQAQLAEVKGALPNIAALIDEWSHVDHRAVTAESRLKAARRALIGTGYFTEDEVGPDVAPRIIELHAAPSAAPQPEPDDDEHFPWHYTEHGVVCACGESMRGEVCPAAQPNQPEPPASAEPTGRSD